MKQKSDKESLEFYIKNRERIVLFTKKFFLFNYILIKLLNIFILKDRRKNKGRELETLLMELKLSFSSEFTIKN